MAIAPHAVLSGSDVELHTFELKAAEAGNVAAVHEAHAQTGDRIMDIWPGMCGIGAI